MAFLNISINKAHTIVLSLAMFIQEWRRPRVMTTNPRKWKLIDHLRSKLGERSLNESFFHLPHILDTLKLLSRLDKYEVNILNKAMYVYKRQLNDWNLDFNPFNNHGRTFSLLKGEYQMLQRRFATFHQNPGIPRTTMRELDSRKAELQKKQLHSDQQRMKVLVLEEVNLSDEK